MIDPKLLTPENGFVHVGYARTQGDSFVFLGPNDERHMETPSDWFPVYGRPVQKATKVKP